MDAPPQRGLRGAAAASLLTPFALIVHGFHPYAEDGGLYLAGIKRVLHPAMYGPHPGFVTAPMRFSLFAPAVAGLVRATHLPLPWMLLALYCLGIWLTLYAGWMLASRCARTEPGCMGAIALLACWLTLPIAGTSLMLMDPYVTARTFSTPLVLLSLAWAIDGAAGRRRGYWLATLALLAAALLHPLMAGYGVAAALLLAAALSASPQARRWGFPALTALALLIAGAVQASAPTESADYVRIAMTRYYWFPVRWQWYEQAGLIAPLLVLLYLQTQGGDRWRALTRAAVQLAILSLVVAVLFAQASLQTHPVARLQPLRCFQVVYELMILLLGAWTGERWLRTRPWRWAAMLTLCGGTMFLVQRATYPASGHLELPWRTPVNLWEQAFLWARDHTAPQSLFAMDAHYITAGAGEDAHCFRAIAERDALPDYSKDGGEASIAPDLTEAWVRGQTAQTGLEQASDATRTTRLKPLGVSWVVLESHSATVWGCPYTNASVKICRVP